MSLSRFEVRDVYGLSQTKLYTNVDHEDPKDILNGVAISGLVGILRQLGDLAEFAAEIFHGIQEEVMVTSSRSKQLKMRLKRLESTVFPLEKTVLAQTNHIHFAYTGGVEWHPRIANDENHIIYSDLPRFIMEPYEECRDPPRLHLLDKFDINGYGSCLKRYSDPTYFKRASENQIRGKKTFEKDKKNRKKCCMSRLASMANPNIRETSTSDIEKSSEHICNSLDSINGSGDNEHVSTSTSSLKNGENPKGVFVSSTLPPVSIISECETESEGDCFVDALYTIESESENDQGAQTSQEAMKNSRGVINERLENSALMDYSIGNDEKSCGLDIAGAPRDDLSTGLENTLPDSPTPLYHRDQREYKKSEAEASPDVEAIKIWTNGGLFGLKPSKPLVLKKTVDSAETEKDEASIDRFASSPPLQDMKISLNPVDTLQPSRLKLKFSDADNTFYSFQLLPETATSFPDSYSDDDDNDTFCRSSTYMSDTDYLSDNHSEQWEESNDCDDSSLNLEPLLPPFPPVQWMVSNTEKAEDRTKSLQVHEAVKSAFEKHVPLSRVDKVYMKNNVREEKKIANAKETETEDFLQLIRTQQNNLRPVDMTTMLSAASTTAPTINTKITAILEKAHSIRQAVANEDGEESDSWSDM